jgi:hypothetical protein
MATPTQTPSLYFLPFTSPNRTPTPHIHLWGGGEVGLALGWGCGIPEPLRDICRRLPGHTSLRPLSMWATLGRCRGLPGQTVHRPRATRAFPHRGLGAGPDRAEARRHLRLGVTGYPDAVSCMDAGYPVHVWGCRCIPGTMTCRRFKDRMISKISEIDREHPWTTRQLFNSITLGHNNDPTLQIISWEGFCQA